MPVDNDRTKGLALPFLILAHVRTGGTFCAHALSNHPQIYCDRGETLHHLSAWRMAHVPVEQILEAIWHQDGYMAAGWRAIYRQAFHPRVWPLVVEARPRIIHLTRANVTRQAVSFGYQHLVRQGALPYYPVHSFHTHTRRPVAVEPAVIVGYAQKVAREMREGRKRLAAFPGDVLEVTYEEMVGNGAATEMAAPVADRIERYLNVRPAPLPVDLVCDFDAPMAEWFSNWGAIRSALQAAGFGGLDG